MSKEITDYIPEHKRLGIVPKMKDATNPLRSGKNAVEKQGSINEEAVYSFDNNTYDPDAKEMIAHNGHMIDNNQYVNFNFQAPKDEIEIQAESMVEENVVVSEEVNKSIFDIQVNDYVLMINGKIIEVSFLQDIEEKIQKILYGEDERFKEVSLKDIMILKRVDVKAGIFIKE